jgi:regulator of sirC expression with transglutaminase-like and TPR domain
VQPDWNPAIQTGDAMSTPADCRHLTVIALVCVLSALALGCAAAAPAPDPEPTPTPAVSPGPFSPRDARGGLPYADPPAVTFDRIDDLLLLDHPSIAKLALAVDVAAGFIDDAEAVAIHASFLSAFTSSDRRAPGAFISTVEIEAILTLLIGDDGFGFRPESEARRSDIAPSSFSLVLNEGKGICVSLSVLAIAVAQLRGIALAAADCPGHFLLTLDDHGSRKFLEVSGDIQWVDAVWYADRFSPIDPESGAKGVPPDITRDGGFLTPMSPRELASVLLAEAGLWHGEAGRLGLGLSLLDHAVELAPLHPLHRHYRAAIRKRAGDVDGALADAKEAAGRMPWYADAQSALARLEAGE